MSVEQNNSQRTAPQNARLTKSDFETWKTSPLNRIVMAYLQQRIDEINNDLGQGRLARPQSPYEDAYQYHSIIGYNKLFNELKELTYEELIGQPEEPEYTASNSSHETTV